MDPGHRRGCLVCGGALEYGTVPSRATCYYCGESHETETICRQGHYVCDRCHRAPAEEIISSYCSTTTETDPVAIARTRIDTPQVGVRGREYHFLVPAALLASYYNVSGRPGLQAGKIEPARQRAGLVKGGFRATRGDCGTAVGTGIFISLVTGATPLSREEWRLTNLMTAKTLEAIALHGGPRCCRRNAYLAIMAAADFAKENLGVVMPILHPVTWTVTEQDAGCPAKDCPFYT